MVLLAVVAVCMGLKTRCAFTYIVSCDCAYLALRCRDRYKKPELFYRRDLVTNTMRFESRTAYVIAVIVVGGLTIIAECMLLRWSMVMVLLLIYALLFARILTGYSLFVRPRREKEIRKLENENYKTLCYMKGNIGVDVAKKGLYDRIQQLMKDKKPFLDEKYESEDMSRQVGTNRTYLSQTLNSLSGWNFCQYVNKHRAEYAAELMAKDKNMLISEVASFSGFHSQTTFNSAFKTFIGLTPSEYKRKVWSKWRKDPSNLQEPGQQESSESSSRDE